jgi:hypothetical protein
MPNVGKRKYEEVSCFEELDVLSRGKKTILELE